MNENAARHHFVTMPHAQQIEAIRRLLASGHSDSTVASATGLSVEMVRRLVAQEKTDAQKA